MDKDHEQQRKRLWCEIYIAYVRASNSTEPDGGQQWADVALKRFDERFPKPLATAAALGDSAVKKTKTNSPNDQAEPPADKP